jgi:hypothetical protein
MRSEYVTQVRRFGILAPTIAAAVFCGLTVAQPITTRSQARGTPVPPAAAPRAGQRASAAKPPTPLTLKQVIESLSATRSSARAEGLVSKAGVQFEATPAVVDILKQFGASQKLISMLPVPSPPPVPAAPPAPKVAGALTIVCEPRDCAVAINERYEGTTVQNRKTVGGLPPGEITLQIFADGYDHLSRRIVLEKDKPAEERFSLKRSVVARQESARASLLKVLTGLGGVDGLVEISDVEGEGTMQWTNNAGGVEQWTMAFKKRPGRDLSATFKTTEGECIATISAQSAKQECKGGLRNRGEKIAEQGASLFLSYQVEDVAQALLKRSVMASEASDDIVESINAKDSYVLAIGNDGLPSELTYRIGDTEVPIQVKYSNYLTLNKGSYSSVISIGRLNSAPAWIFTIKSIRSRALR